MNKNYEDDFFDLIFEKMADSNNLDMDDEKLKTFRNKNSISSDNLQKYINTQIHPKRRKKLTSLIQQNKQTNLDCSFRENQLYYKNGLLNGIYIVISMLKLLK